MHLVDKVIEFTKEQIPFACIHVYEKGSFDIPLGMVTVVTQTEHFSIIENANLDLFFINAAREILEDNHSCELRIANNNTRETKAFVEVFPQAQKLVILGAGHIALPLHQLAKLMGFDVCVIDDRPDYANSERFPEANNVIAEDFCEALSTLPTNKHTYYVLITRGHTFDSTCLKILLNKAHAYIGMVGSLRRLEGVFKLLEQQGYTREQLSSIHAPIGLPIGGDRPQDIALSIIAEITSVQNRGGQWSQSLKTQFRHLKKSLVSKKILQWDS
ncbi:XdhC family protein [Candidatus Uabimicrobium sp. HlEnr_7]|uniref:XdhC family protein n=1 Tax=Candidatus Uabimicrobium helgolandensis TaxID=3095367 RepID=UPI0035563124